MPSSSPKAVAFSLPAIVALLAGTLVALVGSAAEDAPAKGRPGKAGAELAVRQVANEFTSYRQMTPKGMGVFVNLDLARLCIGATQQQVELARKDYGPHTHTAVQIYMNDAAAAAFLGRSTYPVGAVVVKKKVLLNYRVEGGGWALGRDPAEGVGGMIKRAPGYDRANGDWEYFYFEDPAKIETGRIASCVACHARAKSTGQVFGGWQNRPE